MSWKPWKMDVANELKAEVKPKFIKLHPMSMELVVSSIDAKAEGELKKDVRFMVPMLGLCKNHSRTAVQKMKGVLTHADKQAEGFQTDAQMAGMFLRGIHMEMEKYFDDGCEDIQKEVADLFAKKRKEEEYLKKSAIKVELDVKFEGLEIPQKGGQKKVVGGAVKLPPLDVDLDKDVDLAPLKKLITEAVTKGEEVNNSLRKLAVEVRNDNVRKHKTELADTDKELKAVQKEIEDAQKELKDAEKELKQAEQDQQSMKQQDVDKDFEDADKALQDAIQKRKAAKAKLATLQSKESKTPEEEEKVQKAQEKFDAAHAARGQAETARKKAEEIKRRADSEKKHAEAELKRLEAEKKRIEAEKNLQDKKVDAEKKQEEAFIKTATAKVNALIAEHKNAVDDAVGLWKEKTAPLKQAEKLIKEWEDDINDNKSKFAPAVKSQIQSELAKVKKWELPLTKSRMAIATALKDSTINKKFTDARDQVVEGKPEWEALVKSANEWCDTLNEQLGTFEKELKRSAVILSESVKKIKKLAGQKS